MKSIKINHIGLSDRVINALKRHRIFTLGQLTQLTLDEISCLKHIGKESLHNQGETVHRSQLTN